MTCYKYVVTAQKPTSTEFCVKGPFTSPHETNLVLGKGTRIEIYTVTPEGLKPTLEFNIHGVIAHLSLYAPPTRDKASLFILTARHRYCILTYSEKTQQIITEMSGEVGMPVQPRAQRDTCLGVIDPSHRYYATALYESMVTLIIPELGQKSKEGASYTRRTSLRNREGRRRQQTPPDYMNLSLMDKTIVSMAFLQDTTEPTLLILYDDSMFRRYLQTFTIDLRNRELKPGDIVMDHFEPDANLLIALPAPVGGVILVAGKFIRYLKPNQAPKAIGIKPCTINSYTIMNASGSRILLGDANGSLYLLNLTLNNNVVEALCFISLGTISSPSCLAYLGNDVVFVGSTEGDSQVVHVQRKSSIADEDDDILEIIEEFPNLGPITDFCVVDLDKQGQVQLITCSGAAKDSSLRIIRNGVGLNELAAIEISGVKGVWALRPTFDDKHDNMLLVSFVNQTRLLQLRDNEMKQLLSHSGLALDQRTLAARNILGDLIIQVTEHSVRLLESASHGSLVDEWFPSNEACITVASLNPTQCVLSVGYGRLVVLQIDGRRLVETGATQLQQEISCLDITPTDDATPYASSVVAVGVWQQVGVKILSIPDLQVIAEESMAGSVMPRSILMATFENICYLLVAFGDGQFYNFKLDSRQGTLSDKKRSFLGKLPIALGTFTSNGTIHVFAASDKPSVIHSRNQKLVYSNVNLKDVRGVTSFNSVGFPDAVALTTKDALVIGQMEEIQKLHITKISTIDTPRRITYQESSKSFGVVTERISNTPYTAASVTGGFEILDDQSFTVLDRIYFKQFERPLSAVSMAFENGPGDCYILGTGKDTDEFETGSSGRILVLQISASRGLRVVSQKIMNGMVECLRPFNGKLLASVRGELHLLQLHPDMRGGGELESVCHYKLPSITESLITYNNLIVAGDMAVSVVVLSYDERGRTFRELAAEEQPKEITALEVLDEHSSIAAEKEGHLFIMQRRDPEKLEDEHDEPLLHTASQWHLGDLVHRFRFGSLRMNVSDPDSSPITPSLIFATASGAIGVIADLSEERFKLLWQMQNNMNKIVRSIGDLSHSDWRSISMMDRKEKCSNFIDGDLIESFLDLTPQQMQGVVDGHNGGRKLDLTVEDLCKVVEELMSVHS
ncbi:mono-functional DNA-alkylating methyl methanesulfonate N-term-domain-containing protein [Radiomyces spectabilis]|uniref:mono-functional DNA-alkylating methyl methanesulfonate N-term-domain-containing protein n=1 Tax=Radiomyces spectabilis TaxID=64574 RepID=UPI0022206E99|nr:mono-functional DNA-alkylating methyl methanesulfonate N-term-domain-containing protein [Radiomyces spectabilis]KAI8364768.1 mono-functional DNA-alkylating methyl methanesulfonate N-term-domain-containing protein [Radiomyces spectabilis]